MIIRVRVVPRAKTTRVEPFAGGIKVYLPEPALEGRANQKLIEILADLYHQKKKDIAIIKGQKQRDKVVRIGEAN